MRRSSNVQFYLSCRGQAWLAKLTAEIMAVVTTVCMPPLLRWALARVPMRDEEKARLEKEAAEGKDFVPQLERVLVGLDGGDNGRLAGWLFGARHLTATVMEVDGAAKNSGPTSSPSQGVIEAAETAAHAAEAKDPPKDDARDTIDVAMEGAKAEKIPIRELISILPLKVHDDARAMPARK